MVILGISFMIIPSSANIRALSLCYSAVILMMTAAVREQYDPGKEPGMSISVSTYRTVPCDKFFALTS